MLDKGKSRSLSEINTILDNVVIEQIVQNYLSSKNSATVLEIGTGYGRCLLELAWKFNQENVDFHGITLKAKAPLEKREDFRAIAKAFDIVPQGSIDTFKLPEIYFYDATKLHFPDESFDLVYSAVTVRFIPQKAEFVEEVMRVLKPGGCAILDISESNWNYPYSLAMDDRILTNYTNRFVLRYGKELIPLPVYVKLFELDVFQFQFSNTKKCILSLKKLKPGKLDLELDYDDKLSMSGFDLPLKNSAGDVRSGFRTVYNVRKANYDLLFSKGLLQHL